MRNGVWVDLEADNARLAARAAKRAAQRSQDEKVLREIIADAEAKGDPGFAEINRIIGRSIGINL